MKRSVFSGIIEYIHEGSLSVRSFFTSFFTVFPYLLGIGELRKKVTEEYPDPISSRMAEDLPTRSRGLLYNEIEKCTGCKDCEKVCPSQAIRVENEMGSDLNKVWVAIFDIDNSKCIFCGLCAEVCEPQSLSHTRKYERAAFQRKDLIAKFGRGYVTSEQRAKWANMRQESGIEGVVL